MYKEVQKELYDRDVYETEHGFIVYQAFEDGSLYLHLLYVKDNLRGNGVGTQIVDEVVELTKSKVLISYVDLTTKNPELSIKAHLGYGMKIRKSDETSITFYKELK